MQNQPFTSLTSEDSTSTGSVESPQHRLTLLAVLFIASTILIGVRVAYVQVVIAENFLVPWGKTTVVKESIPARNGRILSRDGVILAYDETHYDISLEYRWLEVPFDEVWLRRQIYARLTSEERDDPEAVQLIEEELKQDRSQLFQRLADLTGTSIHDLESNAQRLQSRIERMVKAVESQRTKDLAKNELKPLKLREGLQGMAASIQSELTTAPRRFSGDPIILKEELESHVLVENVPLSVVAAIQSAPTRYQGVEVRSLSSRVYPFEDVAAHLIGLRKEQGTDLQSNAQGGVEQFYNDRLTGRAGERIQKRNRRGEIISSEVSVPPQDGIDTILSIDSRLQRTAEKLLDEALIDDTKDSQPVGGVVMVMNLWTGDLLTAAAAPRYSLQTMLHPSQTELDELQQNPNQPFFPRASRMALPPGSVFKIVTAAAALELGEVTPDEVLECRGYLNSPTRHRCQIFRNYGLGHGEIHLEDALCQSCNVFFYDLSQRIGGDSLVDWSRKFGFGIPTGIDLPSEESGFLPHPNMQQRNQKWYPGSELQLAIGQGALLATPLQVTRMMAAIGNGGYLVKPRIVYERSQNQDEDEQSLKKIEGLSERTLTTIRHGMEMVVHHPRGTGIAALTPSMTIAAKTGTAEVDGKPDHAWFAGFAPVESPRIAFCVVLEHGGSGGDAGPIIKQLMTELIGLGYLQPQWDKKSTNLNLENSSGIASSE
jgi:penicillin-binding protein 2